MTSKSAMLAVAAAVLACLVLGSGPAYSRTPVTGEAPNAPPATKTGNTAPATGCAILPASLIQKTLGQPFSAPTESKWPPAFGKAPWGLNCRYSSTAPRTAVDFIVYEDSSAQEANKTFERLTMWFPPASKPAGIGDSAYIDHQGAIHVLKGKVRYYLSLSPANDKQLKELAGAVAARL